MRSLNQIIMDRPGFSFLICNDSALLKEELEKRAASWHNGKASRVVFWGDEEPDAKFWNSLGQVGLFAENRIVIVRQAEGWPAAVWKQLDEALKQRLDHVWPFFCLEVGIEKGKFKIPACIQKSRCYAWADENGWNWSSQGLAGAALQRFAAAHAKRLGLALSQQELGLFCSSVAPDANSIINELQKLALLASNGKISRDMLGQQGSLQENDAFGLIRKLLAGDLPGAWAEMTAKNDDGLLFFVIAILSREFRNLWQLACGENAPMRPSEAAQKRKLAQNMGLANISRGFCLLAEAEFGVKSGSATPAQALEKLCVECASLFTGKRRV